MEQWEELPWPVEAVLSAELPFDRVLALYRELRGPLGAEGLSPLILTAEALESLLAFDLSSSWYPDELAAYEANDGPAVWRALSARRAPRFEDELEDVELLDEPQEAPAPARPATGGLLLLQPQRAPDVQAALEELCGDRARLVVIRATPAQALLHLGFGAFNDCPQPHQHARVWEHWAHTLGAEPVVVHPDSLEGVAARPCATRTALVELLRECALYDPDGFTEGVQDVADQLAHNALLRLWWD
jgi:hypothetical protein